jgi:hypothetical protein
MGDFYLTSSNSMGPSTRANMGSDTGSMTFVGRNVSIISTTETVIAGSGVAQNVTILGTALSAARGAASLPGSDGLVVVHEGGVAQGAPSGTSAALGLKVQQPCTYCKLIRLQDT